VIDRRTFMAGTGAVFLASLLATIRIGFYLQRLHQVHVSVLTIYKILKRHGVPRVSMRRLRAAGRGGEVPGYGAAVRAPLTHRIICELRSSGWLRPHGGPNP